MKIENHYRPEFSTVDYVKSVDYKILGLYLVNFWEFGPLCSYIIINQEKKMNAFYNIGTNCV